MHHVANELENLDIGITDSLPNVVSVESILAPRQAREVVSYDFEAVCESFPNFSMICACLG